MTIDSTKYELTNKNYVKSITEKKYIILGHTFNNEMKHVNGWRHRYNGYYKKTAAFTIDFEGNIFQHFDTKYYSQVFNDDRINKKAIQIVLENEGWLQSDNEKKHFYNCFGNIYNRTEKVTIKRWRNQLYWAPYTNAQLESAVSLVTNLCLEHNIQKTVQFNNTKLDTINDYEGVLYRSNVSKDFTDISPAFDFDTFSDKIKTI